MRLYLDIDTRKFVASASEQRPVTGIEVKRRDTDLIELQFVRDRVVQELPASATIRLGLKPYAAYTAEFLASGTFTKSGTGTATKYLLDLNLNTVTLNTAFAAATPEPETLAAMLEVEWTSGSNISSSLTLPVTIANDVIRGNEGTPATLPLFYTAATSDFKATQAQAQIGTDNSVWMTPLRTAQAIQGGQIPNPIFSGELQIKNEEDPHLRVECDTQSEWLQIHSWGIKSGWNNGYLSFEEGLFQFNGNDVLYFGGDNELSIGTRVLKNLGAPAAANDAARLGDLASAATHSFTTANQATAYAAPGTSPFNFRLTINSTNLTADPAIILPRAAEGAKFGATYRIVYNRTGHTRSLLVRHYAGGTALTTLATRTTTGVFGFCFNGTDWQTESSWTGLQPVA